MNVIILRRFVLYSILLSSVLALSHAQSLTNRNFTDRVSNIQTLVNNNTVRITWTPTENASVHSYNIYNFHKEIFSESLPFAEVLANIPASRTFFEHTLVHNAQNYYAVTSLNEDGIELKLLLPRQNKTDEALVVNGRTNFFGLESVQGLRVSALHRSIQIIFQGDAQRNYTVYRSTSAIRNITDLNNAIPVARLRNAVHRYTDTVYPNIPYYYAVIDSLISEYGTESLNNEQRSRLFVPGMNTSARAVTIQVQADESNQSPSFNSLGLLANAEARAANNTVNLANSRLAQIGISTSAAAGVSRSNAETLRTVQNILPSNIVFTEIQLEAQILESETQGAYQFARDRELSEIINETFTSTAQRSCEAQLLEFLDSYLSSDLEFRARFYLAQCLYFNEKPQRALAQFSLLAPLNPQLVNPWITAILNIGF